MTSGTLIPQSESPRDGRARVARYQQPPKKHHENRPHTRKQRRRWLSRRREGRLAANLTTDGTATPSHLFHSQHHIPRRPQSSALKNVPLGETVPEYAWPHSVPRVPPVPLVSGTQESTRGKTRSGTASPHVVRYVKASKGHHVNAVHNHRLSKTSRWARQSLGKRGLIPSHHPPRSPATHASGYSQRPRPTAPARGKSWRPRGSPRKAATHPRERLG